MNDEKMERVNVGGILFHNVNYDEALHIIDERIKNPDNSSHSLLLVANQDIINRIPHIDELTYDKLNRSFLVIADGFSIVYGAKYLGKKLKGRVTGPDLMYACMNTSFDKGYKHFFLGAKDGVAASMAERFKDKFPDIKIVGAYSPPFGPFSPEENKKMIKLINDSFCDIVWVSFGCPKQEQWILEHKDKINARVIAGVGAAFDFFSGNVKRAPKIIQSMRLEWLYRVFREPRRLWKRYFIGGIQFIKVLRKQKKYIKK